MSAIDNYGNEVQPALAEVDALRAALAAAVDALREEHDAYIRADEQRKMAEARAQVLAVPFAELETYGCPDCNGRGQHVYQGATFRCGVCNGHGVLYKRPAE